MIRTFFFLNLTLFLTLTLASGLIITSQSAWALERTIGKSGDPVPRFASLKADKVNVRRGPGKDHKIMWVFKKLGLPVKIVSEYEQWREIEDSAGARGWIYFGLLSKRRTAVTIDPGSLDLPYVSLFESAEVDDEAVAKLGKGVIVHILNCDGSWCHISISKKLQGWVKQDHVWGLFDKEPIEAQ